MDSIPHLPGDLSARDPGRDATSGAHPPPAAAHAFLDPAVAHATARRLIPVALVLTLGLCAAILLPRHFGPSFGPSLGVAPSLARTAFLLALAAVAATMLLALTRPTAREDAATGRRNLSCRLSGAPHTMLPVAAGMVSLWWLLAARAHPLPPPAPSLAAACLLALAAFPLLLGERVAATLSPVMLPEAPRLAAVLRLPIAILLLLATLFTLGGAAPWVAQHAVAAIELLLAAAAIETVVRAAASWFTPPPAPGAARAAIGSLLGSAFAPAELAPRQLAETLRSRFGIDFARSWALGFVRRAALPVLFVLVLVGWSLSGLQRVGLAQRMQYERFGAPVAVLQPGLHLLLPWPFGRVRASELGEVHVLGVADDALPAGGARLVDRSGAEDAAPEAANRLWDGSSPDISYLVARADGTRQSFEVVSVDLRVLYRIGNTDAAERASLYGVTDRAGLVRVLARRLLAHFFSSQTLSSVMDQRRERIAEQLRHRLQDQLNAANSGIEIVGLLVDSLHPPVGAASAYRRVQAAEIAARTAVDEERGRIAGTVAVAKRDAHDAIDAAGARAAETTGRAEGDAARMRGDVRAAAVGGPAFLLERRLDTAAAALSGREIELLDHRLQPGAIDLRSPTAAAAADPFGPDAATDQAGNQRP